MKQFKNQKEMFAYIWETREHVSELTGEPLFPPNHFKHHWQYLHVLPKGTYPKYKLNPNNILLATPEEHERQEQYLKFIYKQDELRKEYYKEFYNKTFD